MSFVELFYKVQALFFIFGSVVLIRKIFEKKLSRDQTILATVSVLLTVLAILFVITPSAPLEPHRILRFTVMINCLAVGFFVISTYERLRTKTIKMLFLLFFIIAFVYPTTSYITNYMAFSPDEYPSELHGNMYNIRSMSEIRALERVSTILPDGSTVSIERGRWLGLQGREKNFKQELMNKTILLSPPQDSYIFLRKSLFKHKQYIEYSEDWWRRVPPYVVKLNETEFDTIKQNIEQNNVVYDQGSYRLLYVG